MAMFREVRPMPFIRSCSGAGGADNDEPIPRRFSARAFPAVLRRHSQLRSGHQRVARDLYWSIFVEQLFCRAVNGPYHDSLHADA